MDTGCLSHNTLMRNCKCLFNSFSLTLYKETFFKSLTDDLNNIRYQIMMKCWKNNPDARPTFTKLKNQLKDIETQHKVRILINMKVSFHVGPTCLGSAKQSLKLNSSLDNVIFTKFRLHLLVLSLKLALHEKRGGSELECSNDN